MPRKRRGKTASGNPSLVASPSLSPAPSPAQASLTPSDGDCPALEKASAVDAEMHDQRRLEVEAAAARLQLRGGPDVVYTVAHVAHAITDELLEWAIMDVVLESHRNQSLAAEIPFYFARSISGGQQTPGSNLRERVTGISNSQLASTDGKQRQPVVDLAAHGVLNVDKNVNVECSVCSSSIAASRYAQHLEKCLGRGGRSSSRAASARLKASAEKAEKEAAAEQDEMTVRRRRSASGMQSHGVHSHADGASGGNTGLGVAGTSKNDHHGTTASPGHGQPVSVAKRRKPSPAADSHPAAVSSYGSMNINGRKSGSLPPSGRSRP